MISPCALSFKTRRPAHTERFLLFFLSIRPRERFNPPEGHGRHSMTANDDKRPAGTLDLGLKRFAPGAGDVHVPMSSRKAALAGIAFYAACRRDSVRAQKAAWIATTLLGPRVLPGRPAEWAPPMESGVWERLTAHWRRVVGAFDALAVAHRVGSTDPVRLLLLADGEPRATVKVHPTSTGLCDREASALELLDRSRPRSFRVPAIMDRGAVEGWSYLLLRPLPPRIHHVPAEPPLPMIAAEIHVGLSVMRRPAGVAHHWEPMHGELAPWTLRKTPDDDLFILDWETVSWGPPGADEVFYRASAAVLQGRHPKPIHVREAVDFWRRRAREGDIPDHVGTGFAKDLLRALAQMTPGRTP